MRLEQILRQNMYNTEEHNIDDKWQHIKTDMQEATQKVIDYEKRQLNKNSMTDEILILINDEKK